MLRSFTIFIRQVRLLNGIDAYFYVFLAGILKFIQGVPEMS